MGLNDVLCNSIYEKEDHFEGLWIKSHSAEGWRRQWHPTPVLLHGKSHGRSSLIGCSPWGREESDTTEEAAAAGAAEGNLLLMCFLKECILKMLHLYERIFNTTIYLHISRQTLYCSPPPNIMLLIKINCLLLLFLVTKLGSYSVQISIYFWNRYKLPCFLLFGLKVC